MIRQTDDVRTHERCKQETRFYLDGYRSFVNQSCMYFENGKCTLNACVRKGQTWEDAENI